MRACLCCLLAAFAGFAQEPASPEKPKLLLAFASYRKQPLHPTVFFYEHDGKAEGKLVGSIDTANKRSDYHPALSQDGTLCAFASEQENKIGTILLWNLPDKKMLEAPKLEVKGKPTSAWNGAALAGDGKLLALAGWNSQRRWDIALYDLVKHAFVDVPNLNTEADHERMPALSGDGRFLAFTSNSSNGVGGTDVFLYDRQTSKLVPLPGLNSTFRDAEPNLSHDGRLIVFASDRPGGQGARDIYLYDRQTAKLVPLPGLNSGSQDQTPALSPIGRYVVFASDRFRGAGERDVYLYDRQAGKLLPTPGLNVKSDDIDPCIVTPGL